MSTTTSYADHNRAILAWGAQRLVSDHTSSAEGGQRQLSDFFGVDEPSFNSFIYAQNNPSIPAPVPGRALPGLTRPAQRCVSLYDRASSRPRALARTRRQPATMPATSFSEIAESEEGDRPSSTLPQPKTARTDSLLSRARRVLSLPTGRRSRRFTTSPIGGGTPPTPPGREVFERPAKPERQEQFSGRSHLSHSSRRTTSARNFREPDISVVRQHPLPPHPADRAVSRPHGMSRNRPATAPTGTFAELAGPDIDRTRSGLPLPKVERNDSLLGKLRRVLSMPIARRPSRFTGTMSPDGSADGFDRVSPGNSQLGQRSAASPLPDPDDENEASPADPITLQQSKELQERVLFLEASLETERRKNEEQSKRIASLEHELQMQTEAVPPLKSIIDSAMKHFEAKESALKLTIAQMRHNYTTALAEQNEALRLYDDFDGDRETPRSSTPGSMSTVSESGPESGPVNLRRAQSLDTHRRAVSPRSFFTNTDFEISR